MIDLTTIITTYQRPILLERAITSLLNIKKFLNYQIICVDDSSNYEGEEICEKYHIEYIKKNSNDRRGLAASRNIGLKFAKGSHVHFLDDDDYVNYTEIVSMFEFGKNLNFVFSNFYELFDDNLFQKDISFVNLEHLLVCNQIPVGSFMIRKDQVRYLFDEDLRSHEDWDFILKNVIPLDIIHYPRNTVVIDKTNNSTISHQGITRKHFWLDFLSIYSKFPCARLAAIRAEMLKNLGLSIDAEMLNFGPHINQHKI